MPRVTSPPALGFSWSQPSGSGWSSPSDVAIPEPPVSETSFSAVGFPWDQPVRPGWISPSDIARPDDEPPTSDPTPSQETVPPTPTSPLVFDGRWYVVIVGLETGVFQGW